jgi:phospholipid-translocating ATPase
MTSTSPDSRENPNREICVDAPSFEYWSSPELNRSRRRYPSNSVRTTKYTVWTYLPKAIIAQFNRVCNFYFVFIAILQATPYMSPLDPFSAILPTLFVIGISVVREGFEDYSRYKMD